MVDADGDSVLAEHPTTRPPMTAPAKSGVAARDIQGTMVARCHSEGLCCVSAHSGSWHGGSLSNHNPGTPRGSPLQGVFCVLLCCKHLQAELEILDAVPA